MQTKEQNKFFQSKHNRAPHNLAGEAGAVLVILALGLAIVAISAMALYLSIAETRSTKARLQEIVDSAGQKASASYCSTRACYSDAREIALRAIEDELIRSKLADPGFSLDRSQGPIWNVNNDLKVTVERGYWWPEDPISLEVPLANLQLHSNGRFEPIDRPAGSMDWQLENAMRPQHLLANATYVKIERKHLLDTLAVYGTKKAGQTAEVYAVAGDVNGGNVCAAPFAVHVCSVIDHTGDFNKLRASEYERFFVGVNRYCPENDPNCDVIPGSLWSPVIDETRKNKRNSMSADTFTPDQFAPEGTSPSIMRHTCSYESQLSVRVTQDSIGDQFGVVGLPGSDGTASEAKVINTLLNVSDPDAEIYSPGGCTPTQIGARFDILPDGLTGSVKGASSGNGKSLTVDDIIWQQINDSSEDSYHHPEFGETFLNYGVPTSKAQDDTGWFYNNIEPDTRSRVCKDYTAPRVGACNSRVVSMNRRCIESLYDGLLGWGCSNLKSFSGILNSEFVSACPPQLVDSEGNVEDDPSYYKRVSSGGTSLSTHYDWQSYFNSSLAGPNPSVPRVTPKAWRIPISVLAPMETSTDTSTYASYCQGLGDNDEIDPPFDPKLDYYVIGFVEALFYDTDVGQDSFDPIDLRQICPSNVFDFYSEFQPWGFDGGQGSSSNRCNMVKGVVSRDTELITGKTSHSKSASINSVTLVTP